MLRLGERADKPAALRPRQAPPGSAATSGHTARDPSATQTPAPEPSIALAASTIARSVITFYDVMELRPAEASAIDQVEPAAVESNESWTSRTKASP
jgi:hypothetical protein